MSIIYQLSNSIVGSKYKSKESKYSEPLHEKIDAEDKNTEEYCTAICRHAFQRLMQGRNNFSLNHYESIDVLRSYLYGNQNENYYINMIQSMDPDVDSNSSGPSREVRMKGLENLNTQIVSSMPQIRQAVQGLFSDFDQDAFVETIDDDSILEEEESLAKAYADITLKPFADQMNAMGIPVANESKFPLDTTFEELETYKEMGGFKAKWAEGLEQLIKFTEQQSDWGDVLKRKFIDDYLALNFIMAREVYDEEKNIVTWEYVDPANAVIQYSDNKDFKDAEYAGYFTLEKITKLISKGFDSDKLRAHAKSFNGLFDNAILPDFSFKNPTKIQNDQILDFRIPVFHYYWIETDVKRTLKISHKYGEKNIPLRLNDEIKPLSNGKIKNGVSQREMNTRIRRVYKCSYIVDSEMSYDYGIYENQARKSKKVPMLPFKAYKEVLNSDTQMFGSIVEHVIPFLDRQQLVWLKYQDALMKAHPGGYVVNFRLLQNLAIGSKNIDPVEAFNMFWKYGRGIYMDTSFDGKYEGGDVVPIKMIPGNYGQLLSVLSNEAAYIKNEIRAYTGIDPTTVGVASDSNTATEAGLVKQGTNNILRPMISAIFGIKKDLSNHSAKTIQLLCRNSKASKNAYKRVVGSDVIDMLVLLERNAVEYGMSFEPKPSTEEIQSFLQAANMALGTGRDGESEIDLSHWMYIKERIMNGGNIKKLRRDVAFMIRKKEERDHQMKIEREKAQAEYQKQTALAAAEADKQMELNKAQADIIKQDKITKDQLLIDKNASDLRIKEMAVEMKMKSEMGETENAGTK